jgi:release factor glutamine methyltransferase
VVAIDVSRAAAAVARENARQLGLAERVTVVVGDLSDPLGRGCADLLVSNPPYLPSAILSGLEPEVGAHEPRLALDGGGDGLAVIRRIATSARETLRPCAPLLLETAGGSQTGDVAGLLCAAGFTSVAVRADLAGVDRFVAGRA